MPISLIDHFDLSILREHYNEPTASTVSKLTNCKNCGAPLHYEGNYCKCKYCDTEYWNNRTIVER